MDINEAMKAIETICDYDKDRMMSWLENQNNYLLPSEEVRRACKLLSSEKVFPFDADADDITLIKQIQEFMNKPFKKE